MTVTLKGESTMYLAVLILLYSLFEFVVSRICWEADDPKKPRFLGRAMTLALILALGTIGFTSPILLVGYIVIALANVTYDRLTLVLSEKHKSLELFCGKQLLMGLLLFILWKVASPITTHQWYNTVEGYLLSNVGLAATSLKANFSKILIISSSYFFVIDGGTKIVKGIIDKFPTLPVRAIQELNQARKSKNVDTDNMENEGIDEPKNVGEWIGILERIIILTFVLTANFTAIAFALTAKSIARFKGIEESKAFAEYYLLGTTGSIAAALAAGMIARILCGL